MRGFRAVRRASYVPVRYIIDKAVTQSLPAFEGLFTLRPANGTRLVVNRPPRAGCGGQKVLLFRLYLCKGMGQLAALRLHRIGFIATGALRRFGAVLRTGRVVIVNIIDKIMLRMLFRQQ